MRRNIAGGCVQLRIGFSLVVALWLASAVPGATLVDMDFNGPTGLENSGIGPDGILKAGASISGGQLVLDGSNAAEPAGAGLDLPLGAFGYAFSGAGDFLVEFDFASVGGSTGALFSADGAKFLYDTIPGFNPDESDPIAGGQAGSLNIYSEGDAIVADLWFLGAVAVDGEFDDDQLHNVSLSYNASDAELILTVDGDESDPFLVEDGDGFFRDTSHDIVRLGDENNPDFGADFNEGFAARFDNLLIEGPTPPPLKLIVDRDTGSLTVEAIAATPVNINSISIFSDDGALEPLNYDGIDASNPTFDPNDIWEIEVMTDTEITESDGPGGSDNGATLTNGQSFSLDDGVNGVWKQFFDEDLEISVFDTAFGVDISGIVEYVGDEVLFGDLNLDGEIDVSDYAVFQDGFDEDLEGLSFYDAYFLGDLNGDETHNFEDFIEFASAFDEENGEGAFVAMVQGVPEPSAILLLGAGGIGLFVTRNRRRARAWAGVRLLFVFAAVNSVFSSTSHAAELVEYLFDTNFSDTSGNNRHGIPNAGEISGQPPTVSGGKLQLTGDVAESVSVPLGSANPFGGLSDYTIEMKFSSMGSSFNPDLGMVLFSSADADEPTNDDLQSMSIFIDSQSNGGSLVVDYWFIGEVRASDTELLDGAEHSIIVTYEAPDDPGSEDDPNPGTMYLNIDGDWLATGQIAPRPPTIANHDVRISSSLNTDFPFFDDDPESGELVQVNTEFEGTVDDFRIFDEATVPTLLRAEVDLATGEITLLGGELPRELRYYEITSEAGSLNPAAWNSLEDQGLDDIGAGIGEHWDEAVASPSQLAESFLLDSSLFDEDTEISLGNVFSPFAAQDLEIVAVTADLEDLFLDISYVNAPTTPPGDYNRNGVVDAADYVIWRNTLGQNVPGGTGADGDGNGTVEQNDYAFWRARFGNTSGAGAAQSASVPEPDSLLIAAVAACMLGAVSRRADLRHVHPMAI